MRDAVRQCRSWTFLSMPWRRPCRLGPRPGSGWGLEWQIGPVAPNHGKPVVVSEFESATWLGGLLIWISGEAELDAIRVSDDQAVSKHYDLAGLDDLEVLLGELGALLTAGRIPDAAVVHRQ